jgi:hypothetical protein
MLRMEQGNSRRLAFDMKLQGSFISVLLPTVSRTESFVEPSVFVGGPQAIRRKRLNIHVFLSDKRRGGMLDLVLIRKVKKTAPPGYTAVWKHWQVAFFYSGSGCLGSHV